MAKFRVFAHNAKSADELEKIFTRAGTQITWEKDQNSSSDWTYIVFAPRNAMDILKINHPGISFSFSILAESITFKEYINLDEETANVQLDIGAIHGNNILISVMGHQYTYEPIGMTVEEFKKKILGIMKFSAGKALVWLKKNSKVVDK